MSFQQQSEGRPYATFTRNTVDPTFFKDNGKVYTKIAGGVTHLFYIDDQGVVYQLTPGFGPPPTPYNAAPADVNDSGSVPGVSLLYSRGDHEHFHGLLAGGGLHALVSLVSAGFMSPGMLASLMAAVPNTRQVIAGAGLTGGGDLSADRTFDVVANADGSIVVGANDVGVGVLATDAQHGVRGGGTQHALATALLAGFMSPAQFTALANAVPNTRQVIAGAGLTGGGDLSADRTFDVVANADGSIVVGANDVGVGVLATDAQHGVRGGGTQHALATALLAGFMSPGQFTALANAVPNTRQVIAGAGLTGGGDLSADRTFDVVAGNASIVVSANDLIVGFDATAPAQVGAVASVGAAVVPPHRDHVHPLTFTAPAIGAVVYYDGTHWERLAAGAVGAVLETRGAAAPLWRTPQQGQLFDGAASAFPTAAPTAIAFSSPAPGSTIAITGDGVKKFVLQYRVTVSVAAVLGGTTGTIQIYDNGVAVAGTLSTVGASGLAFTQDGIECSTNMVVTPSAIAHTYDVRVQRTSAGGTITALLNQRTFQVSEQLGT